MSSTNNLSTEFVIDTKQADRAIDRMISKIDKLSVSIKKISDTSIKKLAKGVQQATEKTSKLKTELDDLLGTLSEVSAENKSVETDIEEYSTAMSSATKQSFDLASGIGDLWDKLGFGKSVIGNTLSSINSFISGMDGLKDFNSLWEQSAGDANLGIWVGLGYESADAFENAFSQRANDLSNTINTTLSFGQALDFERLGVIIAEGINEFFAGFDFKSLADMIDTWVQGLYTILVTVLENVEWSDAWICIKEAFNNLDFETVSIVIGALAIKGVGDFIGTEVIKNFVIEKISECFKKGLKINVPSITVGETTLLGGTLISTIAGIMTVVVGAFTAIFNFVDMLKNGFSWLNEVLMVVGIALAAVGAVILGIPAGIAALVAAIVAAVATIVVIVKDNWDAICNWFTGAGEWFNTNVIIPIINFFKGLWETVSGYFASLWESIAGVWMTVSTWFSENVITPIVDLFEGILLRISQIFEGLWIIIQAIWIVVSTWFNENIVTPIVGLFQGLWDSVSGFFSSLWEDIKGIWSFVSTWFNENIITPIVGFFQELWNKVSGFFSSLWENIKTIWSKVSEWFNTNVVQPVVAVFDAIWSGIKSAMAKAMNGIIGGIESAINSIIAGINNILKGFNKVVDWSADIVGVEWGGVTLLKEVKLSRIQGYEFGGFPDKASLFWAGENGVPELMGTVGGKTAVAGGAEITGIREEIRKASNEEIIILKQQNQLLQAILQKEFGITTNDIGKSARAYARDYFVRTGNEAYSF